MSTAPSRLNWPFAAAWAAVTFIGWLLAVASAPTTANLSNFWLAGIFAQLVTLGLRTRLIASRSTSLPIQQPSTWPTWLAKAAAGDHELTWVLCWVSLVHVLGIGLLGPGVIATSALGLAMLTTEILLLRFAPAKWHEHLPPWWPEQLSPMHQQRTIEVSFDWSEKEDEVQDEIEDYDADFESEKISVTFHGLNEEGQPYLQGWQRYDMAAGQKSTALTIGFSPPFQSPPECELDHEGDEDIQLEVEHITPAGVRVVLKRREASNSINGKMLWHCSAI